jgi:histone H3/H4
MSVASKVKAYIKEKGGMNTSASVIEALSKMVEHECDKAVEKAKQDKRKTVMDRDFSHS